MSTLSSHSHIPFRMVHTSDFLFSPGLGMARPPVRRSHSTPNMQAVNKQAYRTSRLSVSSEEVYQQLLCTANANDSMDDSLEPLSASSSNGEEDFDCSLCCRSSSAAPFIPEGNLSDDCLDHGGKGTHPVRRRPVARTDLYGHKKYVSPSQSPQRTCVPPAASNVSPVFSASCPSLDEPPSPKKAHSHEDLFSDEYQAALEIWSSKPNLAMKFLRLNMVRVCTFASVEKNTYPNIIAKLTDMYEKQNLSCPLLYRLLQGDITAHKGKPRDLFTERDIGQEFLAHFLVRNASMRQFLDLVISAGLSGYRKATAKRDVPLTKEEYELTRMSTIEEIIKVAMANYQLIPDDIGRMLGLLKMRVLERSPDRPRLMALVVVRLLLTSPLSRPVEYGVYLGGVNNAAATYLDGLAFTLDNFSSDYFGESTMSGSRSRVKRIKSIVRDILIFYRRVTQQTNFHTVVCSDCAPRKIEEETLRSVGKFVCSVSQLRKKVVRHELTPNLSPALWTKEMLAEFVAYHGFPQYSDMIVAAQSSPFDDNAEADIKKHWPFVKKLGHRKKIMKHFSSLTDQCRQAVYAKDPASWCPTTVSLFMVTRGCTSAASLLLHYLVDGAHMSVLSRKELVLMGANEKQSDLIIKCIEKRMKI